MKPNPLKIAPEIELGEISPDERIERYAPKLGLAHNERIVTFPWMGRAYSRKMKKVLESLGLKVVMPPEITDSTIKQGVKNSSDMMCFPYKVTLGNFIEALEKGVNTLLMYDSCGECRQRHYFKLQEFTLRKLGYEFEMFSFNGKTFIPVMKMLSGKSSLGVYLAMRKLVKGMRQIDVRRYEWFSDTINIGIIGEIFTCCEERVNYEIEQRLRELEVNPYNSANLSEFIDDVTSTLFLHLLGVGSRKSDKRKYMEAAAKFLNGPLGGHGMENIANLLWMKDIGVDGVIHLLPLSCMPEATVEPIISSICQEANIPLLRILIDETNSSANIETRVETFVELIKRKDRLKG